LIPQGLVNLLVAGRCISCDREVQSSLRVMPACFITGQAAGAAAALAVAGHGEVRRVDIRHLQELLRQQGAYIPAKARAGLPDCLPQLSNIKSTH
jgi:hypothetical protein